MTLKQSGGIEPSRQAVVRGLDAAADGTTTTAVLAQAMYREGAKKVAAGAAPLELTRGIERAVEVVTAELQSMATPITGAIIAQVGRRGAITVEETTSSLETTLDVIQGMQFESGYLSKYFVTDAERDEVVLDAPAILIYEQRISSMAALLPILEKVARLGRRLLIIAGDLEGEALATLVVNKLRGTLQAAAVKAPGAGDLRTAMLEDIAALTGGRVVGPDRDTALEDVQVEDLGSARRVTVTRSHTTIVEGGGETRALDSHVAQLRAQVDEASSDDDRTRLRERLRRLTGGVAVIKVGAATEAETQEKKVRIEAAIRAARAAIEEGIVPGGGVALVRAGQALDRLALDGDQAYGVEIVRHAIEQPLRWSATNAGASGAAAMLQKASSIASSLLVDEAPASKVDVSAVRTDDTARGSSRRGAPAAAPRVTRSAKRRPARPAEPQVTTPTTQPQASETGPSSGEAQPPLVEVRGTPHMDVGDEPKVPGDRFVVKVYVDREGARPNETSTDIRVRVPADALHVDLDVWIAGTEHFAFDGPREATLRLATATASGAVSFDVSVVANALDGTIEGHPLLIAYFSYEDRPCGHVSRDIAIRGTMTDGAPPDEPTTPQLRIELSARAADLSVMVTDPGRNSQQLEIRLASPHLNWLDGKAYPWRLPSTTGKLVGALMDGFTRANSPRAALHSLVGAGERLWQALPDIVHSVYWSLVDGQARLETIAIVSQEPYFPWELATPVRGREARRALGVEHAVGRWIDSSFVSAPQRVRVSRSLIVAPRYNGQRVSKLKYAQKEAKYVLGKVQGRSVTPVTYDDFAEAIVRKDYDVLHLACHAATETSEGIQTIHLEGKDDVTSVQIAGINGRREGLGSNPLVFFNCCEVGRPTLSLVGADGFARAFVEAGAAAVVAPLWSVKDDIAHLVCKEFYDSLDADPPQTLAAVLKRVRAKAYGDAGGEDTYAAYSLYGDPNAICVRDEPAAAAPAARRPPRSKGKRTA